MVTYCIEPGLEEFQKTIIQTTVHYGTFCRFHFIQFFACSGYHNNMGHVRALPTLHATPVNWFIKVKLHFQKLPNCTVALSKFQKFSWGGAHRAPSPNPSPDFTRRFAPRFRASRGLGASRLGARFAPTRRFAPLCERCSHVQHLHRSTKNPAYATAMFRTRNLLMS